MSVLGGGQGGGCVWEGHVHVCMEAPEPLALSCPLLSCPSCLCCLALGELCTVLWCAVLCCAAAQRAPLRCNVILCYETVVAEHHCLLSSTVVCRLPNTPTRNGVLSGCDPNATWIQRSPCRWSLDAVHCNQTGCAGAAVCVSACRRC